MRYLRCILALSLTLALAISDRTKKVLENWSEKMRVRDDYLVLGDRGKTQNPWKTGLFREGPTDCLQSIIDGLEDEVLIISSDFRVRQANSAVRRRLGTASVPVVGQPCFRVIHGSEEPCHRPWCECPLSQVLETGQTIRVIHRHWESYMNNGSEKWAEIVVSPILDGYGHVTEVIELIRDVSENKKLQNEALRANRELLALNSIARALNQSLDLRTILQAVTKTMLDALEVQVSWIRFSDDTIKIPVARTSRGLSAEALDTLIKAMSDMGSSEQTTSASYSMMPANSTNDGSQILWQFAVTPLKSEGIEIGKVGVATTKRPLDQQRIQLLDAIGNQIAVAVERCKLYDEVQLARDLRGELLHRVIDTQEEERKRIARELHDETGQTLTALRLCLEKLALAGTPGVEAGKVSLDQLLKLCQQAEEEVDKLIFDLRPALLDDLGLVEAIEFYAQTRLEPAGIGINVKVTGKERRLPGERETAIFRVIQEGITNIVNHAYAKNAKIKLQFRPNQLIVWVEDDGCGFKVTHVASPQDPKRGLGLLGMKERISLVGGSLDIISKPRVGTCLKAIVPLAGEEI